MTRRQLLSALTGCAVAKPAMLNPRRADNWFLVAPAAPLFYNITIKRVPLMDEYIRKYGWEKYE